MITDNKQSDKIDKCHYIALKNDSIDNGLNHPIRSLSRLFRGITSNNNEDFSCLGRLHSFRTDNKLKKHERLCNNHDYCHVEMPTRDNNTLKYNHEEKSLKVPGVNLFMNLLVILYIQLVHLIQNKTNIVLIEEETVLKIFLKI